MHSNVQTRKHRAESNRKSSWGVLATTCAAPTYSITAWTSPWSLLRLPPGVFMFTGCWTSPVCRPRACDLDRDKLDLIHTADSKASARPCLPLTLGYIFVLAHFHWATMRQNDILLQCKMRLCPFPVPSDNSKFPAGRNRGGTKRAETPKVNMSKVCPKCQDFAWPP